MIRIKLFDGRQQDFTAYNGAPLINFTINFYTDACDDDLDVDDEVAFDFSSFVSGYFRIYNERSGRLIKNITGITVSGGNMYINTNDMTFDDNGIYYYELGFIQTGGYELILMYGKLKVI